MRKSNILIVAILVVASIFFLWLWNYLQFNHVDSPLDLIITIIWWVVIIGVCIAIHEVEKRRREAIRTIFLADDVLYNSEAGLKPLPADPAACADAMESILENLEYGSRIRETPDETQVRFKRIVRSKKFSQNGDVWKGEIVCLTAPRERHRFQSEQELVELLAD